jgi:hypothetical protein
MCPENEQKIWKGYKKGRKSRGEDVISGIASQYLNLLLTDICKSVEYFHSL